MRTHDELVARADRLEALVEELTMAVRDARDIIGGTPVEKSAAAWLAMLDAATGWTADNPVPRPCPTMMQTVAALRAAAESAGGGRNGKKA